MKSLGNRRRRARPGGSRARIASHRARRSAATPTRLIAGRAHHCWSFAVLARRRLRGLPAHARAVPRSADRDGDGAQRGATRRDADRLGLRGDAAQVHLGRHQCPRHHRPGADRGRPAGQEGRPAREDRRSQLSAPCSIRRLRIAISPWPMSSSTRPRPSACARCIARASFRTTNSTRRRISWRSRGLTLESANAAIYFAKTSSSASAIITSPINGIVLKKYHEIGDNINYGGQTQAGAGVFDIAQLADTEDMRAEVDINESDIANRDGHAGQRDSRLLSRSVLRRAGGEDLSRRRSPERHRQNRGDILKPDLTIIKPELSVKVTFSARRPRRGRSRCCWCRRRP